MSTDEMLMSVAVQTSGTSFVYGSPQQLFPLPSVSAVTLGGRTPNYPYDVTADGRRFLIAARIGEARAVPLTVIVNWPEALRRR